MGVHAVRIDDLHRESTIALEGELVGLYFCYVDDAPASLVIEVTQEVEGNFVHILTQTGNTDGMKRPVAPTVKGSGAPNPTMDVRPYIVGRIHFHANTVEGSVCIYVFIKD